MPEAPSRFHFHSEAVGDDTFIVSGMTGREEISAPYRFEIELLTQKKPESINLEDLIANTCHLAIRHSVSLKDGSRGAKVSKIHGMLSEFELIDKMNEYVRYRALLVPRLWKLSLTRQSRIFQEMNVKKVVEEVLTDKKSHQFTSEDFEFKTHGTYPDQEFTVQYNESDLDFLHRWLEYHGIFYFFEQTEKGEKVVFCDASAAYLPSIGSVRYRPQGDPRGTDPSAADASAATEETVQNFRVRISKLPTAVVLKDYNYRKPSVENQAQAEVKEAKGEGKIYEYGEHFKTPAEGKAIAEVRAEAIKSREKVSEGSSDVRPFRPGTVFGLADHFHSGMNKDYVVTAVDHRMKREMGTGGTASGGIDYKNDFQCIPSDVVFRPERKTEWPSIHGFMNATIDAGGDGKYAEVDNHGRYKVKMPFDLSDAKDGKASRYLRMAQPYAGENMGMHFPLHKGTEVLIAFMDGDPDRPLITGSVPNPETASPVTGPNQTQSVIHTGGGNKIVIEDTDGKQRIKLHSPTANSAIYLGSPNPEGPEGCSISTEGDRLDATQLNHAMEIAKNHDVHVGQNAKYHIEGEEVTIVDGNRTVKINSNENSEVFGSSTEIFHGSKTEETYGSTNETFMGTKNSKSLSAENEMTIGAKNSLCAAAEHEMKLAVEVNTTVGASIETCLAAKIEHNAGVTLKTHDAAEHETAALKLSKALAENEVVGSEVKVKGTAEVIIDAGAKLVLKCGGSTILITPSAIKIDSPNVSIVGKSTLNMKSNGEALLKGSPLQLHPKITGT